ncbi:MAG: GTPase Era, partial [Chitinophagia bacterium]|nr:GTPase Era [Chitinophagia bacterium]
MKSGFVNIIGKPNAGKSTLLNALLGEKLSIVSSKVQTTRHRIRAFLNSENYQIIFSDTPGVIEPKYKLHEKMMRAVTASLEDADVCLFVMDARDQVQEIEGLISVLKIKVPVIVVLNKMDLMGENIIAEKKQSIASLSGVKKVVAVSANKKMHIDQLVDSIVDLLPEGEPYYDKDELTDLPTKFFA